MLALVYNRLHDDGPFTAVQVVEDVESIVGKAVAADDGTVFVVPYRERARPARNATGGHSQFVQVQFVTVLLIREHGDPQGSARALRFEARKHEIEQLLAGWQPSPGSDSVALVGGESSGLGNGVSIYAQTWETSRFLTGAAQ
jgi:hypothetical protein